LRDGITQLFERLIAERQLSRQLTVAQCATCCEFLSVDYSVRIGVHLVECAAAECMPSMPLSRLTVNSPLVHCL